MKQLDRLADLLATPRLPMAAKMWSGADVMIGFRIEGDRPWSSFYPKDREIVTKHALELSYFFEALRDAFFEEGLIDFSSKIEFFGRLATAADACLLERPDAAAQLICAAVLREAYSTKEQIENGEFDYLLISEGNQIADDLASSGQRTGYSGIGETVEFFRQRGVTLYGTT
jgi:hypothetical protein